MSSFNDRLQREKENLFVRPNATTTTTTHTSRNPYEQEDDYYPSHSLKYPSNNDSYDSRRLTGVNEDNARSEDVEYVQAQLRNTKMKSLASSRNALRKVHDAEGIAANTLTQLGAQSEMLNGVENRMDVSQIHAQNASSKAADLKSLNRSMFLPHFKNPFTKKKRAEAKIAKAEAEHLSAQQRQDDLRTQQRESRSRIKHGMLSSNSERTSSSSSSSRPDRSRYQFEADAEDDAIEDELESNVDDISNAVARLKGMSLAMQSEIQNQNRGLDRLSGKVDQTGATIAGSSARLRSIK